MFDAKNGNEQAIELARKKAEIEFELEKAELGKAESAKTEEEKLANLPRLTEAEIATNSTKSRLPYMPKCNSTHRSWLNPRGQI